MTGGKSEDSRELSPHKRGGENLTPAPNLWWREEMIVGTRRVPEGPGCQTGGEGLGERPKEDQEEEGTHATYAGVGAGVWVGVVWCLVTVGQFCCV